jgi:hypothetical protein
MNNTRTLAVVAVLMAATLVVGTFATMATTQSAFAIAKKPPGHDDKKTRDNGSGNRNGNTITALKCQNKGSASGFDSAVDQECENLICTHPGSNATCVSESEGAAAAGGGGGGGAACSNGLISANLVIDSTIGAAVCVLPGSIVIPVPAGGCTGTLAEVQLTVGGIRACATVST